MPRKELCICESSSYIRCGKLKTGFSFPFFVESGFCPVFPGGWWYNRGYVYIRNRSRIRLSGNRMQKFRTAFPQQTGYEHDQFPCRHEIRQPADIFFHRVRSVQSDIGKEFPDFTVFFPVMLLITDAGYLLKYYGKKKPDGIGDARCPEKAKQIRIQKRTVFRKYKKIYLTTGEDILNSIMSPEKVVKPARPLLSGAHGI